MGRVVCPQLGAARSCLAQAVFGRALFEHGPQLRARRPSTLGIYELFSRSAAQRPPSMSSFM